MNRNPLSFIAAALLLLPTVARAQGTFTSSAPQTAAPPSAAEVGDRTQTPFAGIYRANPWYHDLMTKIIGNLSHHGGSSAAHAMQQAQGRIVSLLMRQASLLSYIETVHVLAYIALIAVPLVFIAKATKPGEVRMGH